MGKPHPVELRDRAVRLVEEGSTQTEAARRLCASIKLVDDMVRLRRETVWIGKRQRFMARHLERLAFLDGEA